MLQANDFIGPAKALGFDSWAGVPCSFLTPFINGVIDDPDMSYLSAANEGDAVAAASGAALAGRRAVAMMQNSGLGNAVWGIFLGNATGTSIGGSASGAGNVVSPAASWTNCRFPGTGFPARRTR